MDNFDFAAPLKIPFKIFTLSGMWQDEKATKLYKFYGLLHFFGVGVWMLGELIYMIYAESLLDASDNISILFTYVGMSVKSFLFVCKLKEITRSIEDLKGLALLLQEKNDGKSLELLKQRTNQTQTIFHVTWGLCLTATFFSGVVPIVSYIANPHPPYKIGFKTWAPFDFTYSFKGFVCIAAFQILNPVFYCGVVASGDLLPVFFFNAATGLLEEFSDKMKTILAVKVSDDDVTKNLVDFVEIHLKIKSFIKACDRTFAPMIFTQGAISLIILCTGSFTMSKVILPEA